MSPAVSKLPKHLTRYIVKQNYAKYTAEEHATWRFIMRQNRAYFAEHAVPVYLDGLQKTGIPVDRIPNIDDMDDCLARFGYGAVGVCGFIPPAIFLEFQALGIMPIATDMRTVNHVGYTPAPDIVHEAAGHAPVVADPAYRAYLRHYGQIAHKALFSQEDVRLYEAIRWLSDIKENPDTRPEEISAAQRQLDEASAAVSFVSESTKVGRMGWWTIEYGLCGPLEKPRIFGAGLLSSVAESQACLSPKVKKVPLTVHCVEQAFDITEPQPQLFVVPSLDQLPDSLTELDSMMSYRKGGAPALTEAIRCGTVNSVELDSGVAVGGVVANFVEDRNGVSFIKLVGPSQIGIEGIELKGHSTAYHKDGFSSPIGFWQSTPKPPQQLTDSELDQLRIRAGQPAHIQWQSGFELTGTFTGHIRSTEGTLLVMSFNSCTVRRGDQIFFHPDWGTFDLIVGTAVASVYSGPPDRDEFGSYEIGKASSSPGRQSPFTAAELKRFEIYSALRAMRSSGSVDSEALEGIIAMLHQEQHDQWLLWLEVLELLKMDRGGTRSHAVTIESVVRELRRCQEQQTAVVANMITKGIELSSLQD